MACDPGSGACFEAEPGTDAGGVDAADTASPDTAVDTRQDAAPAEDTAMADTGADVDPTLACLNELTRTCDSYGEPNDRREQAVRVDADPYGCWLYENELRTFQRELGGSLCPDDRQDWYRLELRACPNRTYVVEVRLVPRDGCTEAVYGFEVYRDDTLVDCSDTTHVRCEPMAGGGQKIAFLVERDDDQPRSFAYARVFSKAEETGWDVRLDYDVEFIVRQ